MAAQRHEISMMNLKLQNAVRRSLSLLSVT